MDLVVALPLSTLYYDAACWFVGFYGGGVVVVVVVVVFVSLLRALSAFFAVSV
jgi:hypothetical protein